MMRISIIFAISVFRPISMSSLIRRLSLLIVDRSKIRSVVGLSIFAILSAVLPGEPAGASLRRELHPRFLYALSASKAVYVERADAARSIATAGGFAFHKFQVVGGQQLNNNQPFWYASYLQTIHRNSFGNFRNMLFELTLNPSMGEYLNMRGNSVISLANPTPNENYAREIMQLFSIGVETLNQDGTPVLDAQGNRVPSYY